VIFARRQQDYGQAVNDHPTQTNKQTNKQEQLTFCPSNEQRGETSSPSPQGTVDWRVRIARASFG
jgi:hypothetical protein